MEYLITTPRLGLRRWQPKDLDPFAEMNADPAVREFFPNVMTREESAASMSRIENQFDKYGYGWYAVDLWPPANSSASSACRIRPAGTPGLCPV